MSANLPIRILVVALPVIFSMADMTVAMADAIFYPSPQQLFDADDVTLEFGGNGMVLDRQLSGQGVVFEIENGTTDFGKVSLQIRQSIDLSAFDSYSLYVEVLSAEAAVEVNPFVRTGNTGLGFFEVKPGSKVEGDSFLASVPLAGLEEIDNVYSYGFQCFTAGDIVDPVAQRVVLRVSAIPEPSLVVVTAVMASLSVVMRRRRAAD